MADRCPYPQTWDSGAVIEDYRRLGTLEAAHSSADPDQSQSFLLQSPTNPDSGLSRELSSQSTSGDYDWNSQSLSGDFDHPCCWSSSNSRGITGSFHPDCYYCCFHSNQKRLGQVSQWWELERKTLVETLEVVNYQVIQIPERDHYLIDYLRSYY